MKKPFQFVVITMLLSAGALSLLYSTRSVIERKTDELRQLVDSQPRQEILFKHRSPVRLFYSLWLQSASQWADKTAILYGTEGITISKGKHPALLWHRFSLTPHQEFVHWILAMWSRQGRFMLLTI